MEDLTVTISGVHSDSDPSPGIGIARSLREAFPKATLQAVDYSVRSSGLHHPVFDSILLQPVWSELDLDTYSSQIRQHLGKRGDCWISGLDVESDWLAAKVGEHPRLLIPTTAAQDLIRKPVLACAPSLGMRVPEFLPASSAPTNLHTLGRRSGWHLWVKGKYHEAYCARSFAELGRQIRALQLHWPLQDIFVQQHISGLERSITFAAYDGRLLQAVEVEKRSVTSQGKTWSASVMAAPADVTERLASLVAKTRWTGGGEVEFVRDLKGEDWLIDFNPRFPAYIFGVTLCGQNLPALVVSHALDIDYSPQQKVGGQFIRVVQELPVRENLQLPAMVPTIAGFASAGKHPSFQPELVRRLKKDNMRLLWQPEPYAPAVPESFANWHPTAKTPLRFRDFSVVEDTLKQLAQALDRCCVRPAIIPALSVKTDPNPILAQAFLRRGWWAEVISLDELNWAQRMGFKISETVFNGPRSFDLASCKERLVAMAFADSVEALEALLKSDSCGMIGLRVRAGIAMSRFGIDLTDFRAFDRVIRCLSGNNNHRKLGIHMHFASDVIGPTQWNDCVDHALAWGHAIAQESGAIFSVFDLGGGWHPDDFRDQLIPMLPTLQARIAQAMPSVDTILLEPGKAVASETAWLATRVLEIRSSASEHEGEIVVDASIADLPMAAHYAHSVLHFRDELCLGWLTGGSQRILGSICMETDILAERIAFPCPPVVGDQLIFSSAGGYNASMAWHFAAGVSRDT